ncbi:MAG: ribulose-phosphate 3-epimerase [Lachnospiraceae bacterium]|nr:ribulose-phosphate 3-epimerase [Lachnospiraceae bacterium]
MIHFAPSILSADFTQLQKEIDDVQKGGADYLHFDVMDGMFVPSISFGMPVLKCVAKKTELFLDVHLMIVEPERYVEEFVKSGADLVTVHLETLKEPEKVIKQIHDLGAKAGLAINPETPAEQIRPYLAMIDMALVMSVHPGFGGQAYIPSSDEKIAQIASWIREEGLKVDLEVDGGIKLENVEKAVSLGANVIVAGSAVFHGDAVANTKCFVEKINKIDQASL